MISRRDFLQKSSALAGGSYSLMLAMGLLKAAPAHSFTLNKAETGKNVLILGAGLCGMAAAYELSKIGYTCTLLEARERTGGRCWSPTRGTISAEAGKSLQRATFDEGLYFNAGPSRIPHNHELTLHYCRELGVPIQVYNNVNEGAYLFSEGNGKLANKKVRAREIHNDMRGYTSELLAKAADQGALDKAMTKEDAEKVIEYLRAEGGLDPDRLYKGSNRRGYGVQPGAGNRPGKIAGPYLLSDIISSGLIDPDFYNVSEYTYELQMTMFQAVGGMEQIAKAFEKKVGPMIKKGAEVTEIMNREKGVEVIYTDSSGKHKITADLCICTLPLTVLTNINHNFSSDVSRAIDFTPYIATGKIGLQFNRRFWEEDENIYGGITHTNNELTQIFYPSNDYLGRKGILIGYYNFNEKARAVGELSINDRERLALKKGALIHSQYPAAFETSFSVSWQKVPYSLGGWSVYTDETRQSNYAALIRPDKYVYFAGEHTSYLNSWMAGAFESARSVVTDIHARVTDQRLQYPTVRKT